MRRPGPRAAPNFTEVKENPQAADSRRAVPANVPVMRFEELILVLLAVASSATAVYLWHTKMALGREIRALRENCRTAESENARLRQLLSALQSAENGRIARLEHDLKSPLGVILGFSTLLREFAEGQSLPALPLRCISGMDQASRKMLQIIDAAAQDPESDGDPERTVAEEKAS